MKNIHVSFNSLTVHCSERLCVHLFHSQADRIFRGLLRQVLGSHVLDSHHLDISNYLWRLWLWLWLVVVFSFQEVIREPPWIQQYVLVSPRIHIIILSQAGFLAIFSACWGRKNAEFLSFWLELSFSWVFQFWFFSWNLDSEFYTSPMLLCVSSRHKMP